jgi:hypothetical protein
VTPKFCLTEWGLSSRAGWPGPPLMTPESTPARLGESLGRSFNLAVLPVTSAGVGGGLSSWVVAAAGPHQAATGATAVRRARTSEMKRPQAITPD